MHCWRTVHADVCEYILLKGRRVLADQMEYCWRISRAAVRYTRAKDTRGVGRENSPCIQALTPQAPSPAARMRCTSSTRRSLFFARTTQCPSR